MRYDVQENADWADQHDELAKMLDTFEQKNKWAKPALMTGYPVPYSGTRSFSSICTKMPTSNNDQFWVQFRYRLAWIHAIVENILRWLCGVPAYKPVRTKEWYERVVVKSLVPTFSVKRRNFVVYPYIEGIAFSEALSQQYGFTRDRMIKIIAEAASQLNKLHRSGMAWGQPTAANFLLDRENDFKPVIVDGEVEYAIGTGHARECAWDFLQLICSTVGCCKHPGICTEHIVQTMYHSITYEKTRTELKQLCRRKRTFFQNLFWIGFGGMLMCSKEQYDEACTIILHMPDPTVVSAS